MYKPKNMSNNPFIKLFAAAALLMTALSPTLTRADVQISITPGAVIFPNTWSGENKDTGEKFSSSATNLGINLKFQWRDLYTGISLAGSEYEFKTKDYSPARPSAILPLNDDPIKIKRNEFDLLIGYYVWDMVSLFVDLRSKSLTWSDDYVITYAGLGGGVTGHYSFSSKWTIFGSLGASSLDIKSKERGYNERNIGDGVGTAAEFGVLFRMTKMLNLYGTLKSQRQEYRYDNNITEIHDINGIKFGVSTVFSL
ncbi:MAG: hypothetical protein ACC635_05920 [Acidiferrobacterales bacterium]